MYNGQMVGLPRKMDKWSEGQTNMTNDTDSFYSYGSKTVILNTHITEWFGSDNIVCGRVTFN